VHPASVTNAVDRLEAQGLIRRLPHATDRRATLAEILPEGRDIALRATKELNQQVFEQTGLSADDTAALTGVLRTLRAGSGDFE
jgi:DNA-binding MarR family transcriptional regulator